VAVVADQYDSGRVHEHEAEVALQPGVHGVRRGANVQATPTPHELGSTSVSNSVPAGLPAWFSSGNRQAR